MDHNFDEHDTREGAGSDPRSLADRERDDLADQFELVGPTAPTLCEGWTTEDLAAHLVLRERSPAAAGLVVPSLAEWTQRKQRALTQLPYRELVARFRRGPSRLSPLRLPGVQAAINTFEHFVHHEDVLRAADTWQPRNLSDSDETILWRQLCKKSRLYLRRTPVPVTLATPAMGEITHGDNDEKSLLRITAPPSELVMYLHGRRDHAHVELEASAATLEKWSRHRLRV